MKNKERRNLNDLAQKLNDVWERTGRNGQWFVEGHSLVKDRGEEEISYSKDAAKATLASAIASLGKGGGNGQ
ncbi:hypothetical protein A2701_00970 [Candidatus Amesbacteria bacterium RIFCSPHIGHO2_01_FULL_47_34]|uniref:Uncharacterized protein n=1 Tax=Candidatus Amesbacteria bacterium RIFCSPLOWO2_01_FULL_47_33 TaxID=1797258 RepID=A0A1F4Z0W8_9BACT|nr:MAG: hypothetical protein A2972_04495 [Candidatus Amesbacteria bacterium RIFCSPLOWO2_01_FULL_47_33]OGD00489.1 MAG: hypothetical protein A2701_00970 [Candidatus Amesbacteria bacterium RIFCSPHIGHO2_01_FULL_47_34]